MPTRRFRVLAGSLAVVIAAAGLSFALPALGAQSAAAAGSTTALSTVSKSGTDTSTNSTAVSGGAAGTANPGDTIKWVTNYTNNTNAAAQLQWKDPITAGQSYVSGSLQVPAGLTPQYSTNGGATYTSGSPAAGSTGVGATGTIDSGASKTSTTFTNTVTNFTTVGGDGYSVEGFGGNIYTVFHHSADSTTVFCATLSNAVCPGWPAQSSYVSAVAGTPVGTGAIQYTTAGVNGSFINNGKLYWQVEALSPVAGRYPVGLQCLNLTTQQSCGFTQLDAVTLAPLSGLYGHIAGDGIQATNGRYYFVDSGGNFLCFDPVSVSSCGVVNPGIGPVTVDAGYFAEVGTYGSGVFFTYSTGNNDNYLFGFNTATATPTFVTAQFIGPNQSGWNVPSEVLPVLSSTGTVLGACSIYHAATNTGCFNTSNVQIANPYALSQYSFSPGGAPGTLGFGTGVVMGTKYYITFGSTSTLCFDFALRVGNGQVPACSGFSGPADLNSYTVRPLANLPGCMADNGDGAQIKIFNGATGGSCVTASSSVTVQAPSWCDGQAHALGWGTVTLSGLNGSEYTGGASVTVSGTAGVVPGFSGVTLAPGQTTLNISSIPATGSTASLTVSVNLSGVTNQAKVAAATILISRTGDTYSQMCYSTTVNPVACATSSTISNVFTAITTTGAATDSPAGNSVPAATFTVTPTSAQCTLALKKVASEASGSPGDTVSYTVTVTNSGTMAYTTAAPATFTDSLANVLADATYNNNAAATLGSTAYSAPTLSWSGPLAAGATATITYSVKVNKPDSGPHNLANTIVSTQPSNCAAGSTDPACTAGVSVADISVAKSATPSDAVHFTVGQVITYSFVVTNTGNVALTNPTVTEGSFSGSGTMSAPSCPTTASLAPGAQMTCTATYTLTQADVDAGSITNHATSSGTTPSGGTVTSPPSQVTIPAPDDPSIALLKSASPATLTAAGQTVTYSFVVTNTGNVTLTNPTVTEGSFTGSGAMSAVTCPATTSLLPGASMTCTATYVATQKDVDAGSITNTATASGIPPSGAAVTSPPSSATVTASSAPAITIVKTANPSTVAAVGQLVSYSFLVTNSGNVTLTNPTVTEGTFTGSGAMSAVSCPATASLLPAAQMTCTASYTVTQADLDAGSVTNTATASGTPPTGATVTSPPSSATVTASATPTLTIVKSATPSTVTGAGAAVTYSFLVTNTGNVTLTGVSVAEGAFSGSGSLSAVSCPSSAASLAPGASVTCTASYTATQADVDAGKVTNTSTAAGTSPSGGVVTSPPSSAKVTITPAPAITVVKSASPSDAASFTVGRVITYSFVVTNTGNVTLTSPTVTEGSFSGSGVMSVPSCPATAPLAPGAQITCTATYTVTQADVDAGSITNTATAKGTPPSGPDVTSPPSQVTIPAPSNPAISLLKTADPTTVSTVGQTVTYSFLVTNTGNVTLTNVAINEAAFSGTGTLSAAVCPAGAASLVPGAQVTCTATYTLTQADVDAGVVTNTATASGTSPSGSTTTSNPSTASVTVASDPGLSVVKTATPTTVTAVGQVISYSFLVTNTGNVTLKKVAVAETAFSGSGALPTPVCPSGASSLAPGASVTCTASYTATQADVDSGSITNTATVSGTPPSGGDVTSPPSSAKVTITPAPAISIVKSASPSDAASFTVGRVITYSFVVTNTGNVTLTNVKVNEGSFSGSGAMSAVTCPGGAASLAPGAQVTCTATYAVTQADVDAGSVRNDATASGTSPSGSSVVSAVSAVTIPAPQSPALTVVKSASPATPTAAGQTVTYSFAVTNTGNVTLTGVAVVEGAFSGTGTLSAVSCPSAAASLLPGARVTCIATYVVTQADADAGSVTNSATATGTPPSGPQVTSPPSQTTITITPAAALTVVKSATPTSPSSFTVGQVITYSFLATNTGNVTLTNVTVDEGAFTGSGAMSAAVCPAAAASLAPGDQVTCTASYTLTQADVDAGSITNSATVAGDPPRGSRTVSPPSEVTIPAPAAPAITLVKTADISKITAVGQTITYSFLVTNSGNVTLTDVGVVEGAFTGTGAVSTPKCPAAAASMAPGQQVTCTATYLTTAADLRVGAVANTATSAATLSSGQSIASDPSTVKLPVLALGFTGTTLSVSLIFAAVGSLILGGLLLAIRRRRSRHRA